MSRGGNFATNRDVQYSLSALRHTHAHGTGIGRGARGGCVRGGLDRTGACVGVLDDADTAPGDECRDHQRHHCYAGNEANVAQWGHRVVCSGVNAGIVVVWGGAV